MTVLCWVEVEAGGVIDPSGRALAVAGGLAASGGAELAVCWFGEATAVAADGLFHHGVSEAHAIASGELSGYAPVAWARALAGLAAELGATSVIAAATDRGNEVLAHLGAITGQPMAANCVTLTQQAPGEVALTRQRWAGSLTEEAVLAGVPALATVTADAPVPEQAPAVLAGAGAVAGYEPRLAAGDLAVLAAESAERSSGASLATARVVVGGGRGVGGAAGFTPLDELAELLGGVVGVSRVVTGEGWRPHRQQVGQTGTRIAPELYLACGISGAIQHLAGCQSAKHVIAVNTDRDAPIMARAEYAVIGDLHEVIPALVAALRAR